MEIKDGGFVIKSKNLSDSVDRVFNDANDSSLTQSIKGPKDVAAAEKLLEQMQLAVDMLNCQMDNIKQQVNAKKKTFVIREK